MSLDGQAVLDGFPLAVRLCSFPVIGQMDRLDVPHPRSHHRSTRTQIARSALVLSSVLVAPAA
jgi:hypothetical protein